MMSENENPFKKGIDYPNWMTKESITTLVGGYLNKDETPFGAIHRIADTSANKYYKKPELYQKMFDYIANGYICLSTPVWINFGNSRGYPISCFGSYINDSIKGIAQTMAETMVMSQQGGGTSAYFGDIRERGALIKSTGGTAKGIVPPLGIVNDIVKYIEQGDYRKGAFAGYYPIDGPEINEFLSVRQIGSDIQRILTGVTISDDFIDRLYASDKQALEIWAKCLESRAHTGMPYLFFTDNANNHSSTPEWYGYKSGDKDRKIKASNLCTEIMLPSNDSWSFVCDLLSMNLAKYDEWKDTDAVEMAIYLLDSIMTEFVDKTDGVYGMDKARQFAIDNRSLGLGVLGWHTYLQDKGMPFLCFGATNLTHIIFKDIQQKATDASIKLGNEYGACAAADGIRRNAALMAVAPTVSNATIMGECSMNGTDVSAGIEPIPSNYYSQRSSKGTFTRKNKNLEILLENKGYNTTDVWNIIRDNGGSVQELDFLDAREKELFKTFEEINQFGIIEQAAIRQLYIDQGQSVNVNIPPETPVKDISKLYLFAHKKGLKSIYYQRSKSVIRGFDVMDAENCVGCSG